MCMFSLLFLSVLLWWFAFEDPFLFLYPVTLFSWKCDLYMILFFLFIIHFLAAATYMVKFVYFYCALYLFGKPEVLYSHSAYHKLLTGVNCSTTDKFASKTVITCHYFFFYGLRHCIKNHIMCTYGNYTARAQIVASKYVFLQHLT